MRRNGRLPRGWPTSLSWPAALSAVRPPTRLKDIGRWAHRLREVRPGSKVFCYGCGELDRGDADGICRLCAERLRVDVYERWMRGEIVYTVGELAPPAGRTPGWRKPT